MRLNKKTKYRLLAGMALAGGLAGAGAASAAALTRVGERLGNMGKVILAKDGLYVTEQGKAYSPFAPERALPKAPKGKVLVKGLEECQGTRKDAPLPIVAGERVVDWTSAKLAGFGNAVAAVVRTGEADPADPLDYKPYELRIYVDGKLAASHAFKPESYPCQVIAQNLRGDAAPELAVTWISVGNRYSVGATVFTAR